MILPPVELPGDKPRYCVRCGRLLDKTSVALVPNVGYCCYPPCLSPEIKTILDTDADRRPRGRE